MSLQSFSNQVLALAGMYQACQQIKELAWNGECEFGLLDTAVNSVYKVDAKDIDDIYGGIDKLNTGLHTVADQFNPKTESMDHEITRYVLSLFVLEKKLSKNKPLLAQLKDALDQSQTQRDHYGIHHPNTWASLADVYQKTISTLTPRIMINGDRLHLSNNTNVTKIRSLLLAAIRSVVLWRQCGGSRLSFLFNRRNYYNEANNLLVL